MDYRSDLQLSCINNPARFALFLPFLISPSNASKPLFNSGFTFVLLLPWHPSQFYVAASS
jgi:hypothetical protein